MFDGIRHSRCGDLTYVRQRFERGTAIGSLASAPQPAEENGVTGTSVCFKPDLQIFTVGIEFDYSILSARLRERAYLNGGVRIVFRDEREAARDKEGQPREEAGATMKREVTNLMKRYQALHEKLAR